MEKFDVVVIGGGPGGYPAAIRAAQLGASVAIVEMDAFGGTCLNRGCIPTKTLIASSDLYYRMNHAAELGLSAGETSFDYNAIVERKDGVVAKLRKGISQLLKANKVNIFDGLGAFESRNIIRITQADGDVERIEAGRCIIATGSRSAVPGFLPEHQRVVDSTGMLALTELPESMIVLGGGVIGCEFACMAAQLGTKVTIVELLDDILVMLDADIRREMKRRMKKELGITIITGNALADIKANDLGVSGVVGEEQIEAELMLAAIGRQPMTEGLELANAGIDATELGFVEINEYCGTRVPGIYAVGDVTLGSTQLAHAATAQGITAAENCVEKKRVKASRVVPACIFTVPEVGCVGITEIDAKEQGMDVKIGKFMFGGLGKAMASGEAAGFTKLIASTDTGQILGASVVGPHATELISEAAVAINMEMTTKELAKTIHCHPTFSEAWMEAAEAADGECIHQAPKRR